MGLDISVIRTPGNIDLEAVYAVRDAVESGYNWYLGDDREKRAEKWKELKDKCRSLTKEAVLKNISGPEDLVKCIGHMSESDFNTHLAWVFSSITDHEDGNTHLNFDYGRLPGKVVFDSCSRNLYGLFRGCEKDNRTLRPCGDFIREIDPYRVWAMGEKWNAKSWKIGLAKWVSYLSERVGFSILRDCLGDLGVDDVYVDFRDARHYQDSIRRAVDDTMDNDDRLWLVASY